MEEKTLEEDADMLMKLLKELVRREEKDIAVDAEYAPCREELSHAGLDEEALRCMDPDERVAALEQACLDPYDYIYLAC